MFFSQEVLSDNDDVVVSALCQSSLAYSNQWKVPRAEDLAVEAVQQAKYVLSMLNAKYG